MRFSKTFIQSIPKPQALHVYGNAQEVLVQDKLFSFLVWNVNKYSAIDLNNILIDMKQQPDFYFLQEVKVQEQDPNVFIQQLGYEWIMGKHLYFPRSKKISGVKTGSIFSTTATNIFHTTHTESISLTPKAAALCTYPIKETHLTLLTINVHFLNFVSLTTFAKELNKLALLFSTHQGPLILTGDFNTWSKARKNCLLDMITSNGLLEAKLSSPYLHRYTGKQLSFLFTRNIHIQRTKILRTITYSDHFPLWGEATITL